MGNAMINALIAAGIVFAIGYGWITHLQNRGPARLPRRGQRQWRRRHRHRHERRLLVWELVFQR
ncbi:hypothetical protein ACVWXM_005869 [Bradyrhizobium sp. GM7.3]